MSERAAGIEQKLRERLDAVHVEVIDESHQHVGHAGAADGRGHFRVLIVSPRFQGMGRVAAQRVVYEALGEEMKSEIHALSISVLTPEQWRGGSA